MTEIPLTPPTDFQLPKLHHIGMVVRDRDATIRHYEETLGITSVFAYDAPMPNALVHGKPTTIELRVAFTWSGNTLIELLQPLNRESPYFQFLEEHGEGVHHFGFFVPNVDDYLARIEGKGLRLLVESAVPAVNLKTVVLEGDGLGGVLLEVMQEVPAMQDFFQQVYQGTGREPLP